jgi:hypothetical protein
LLAKYKIYFQRTYITKISEGSFRFEGIGGNKFAGGQKDAGNK